MSDFYDNMNECYKFIDSPPWLEPQWAALGDMRLDLIDVPRQDVQNLFDSQPMSAQNQIFESAGSFGSPS